MTLLTLYQVPNRQSFLATANDTLSVRHQGGAGRYRVGTPGEPWRINAMWMVDEIGFQYLRAFYRTGLSNGSLPFVVKLRFPKKTVTKHKAFISPGSLRCTIMKGLTFAVEMQLIVDKAERA